MFLLDRRALSSKSRCLWHFPVLLPFNLNVPRLPRPIPPAGTQTVAFRQFSWENCWFWFTRLAATCRDWVCVWSCNEFLEKEKGKKKAINDRGGFSAYNPPPPTIMVSLLRRKTNKAWPRNRMTRFAVGHSFISLIVARFLLFFFMFLSSCNQMRRCCLG